MAVDEPTVRPPSEAQPDAVNAGPETAIQREDHARGDSVDADKNEDDAHPMNETSVAEMTSAKPKDSMQNLDANGENERSDGAEATQNTDSAPGVAESTHHDHVPGGGDDQETGSVIDKLHDQHDGQRSAREMDETELVKPEADSGIANSEDAGVSPITVAQQEKEEAKAPTPLPKSPSPSPAPAPVPVAATAAATAAASSSSPSPSPSLSMIGTERTMHHSVSSAKSLTRGGAVFVVSALETISSSKEARRNKALKESATTALDMVRRATSGPDTQETPVVLDPRVVFEPLRQACASKSVGLQTTSLDCIAKLVSYAFFAEDDAGTYAQTAESPLADLVVETVCDCFDDQLDERVSVQIVKALLACVLSVSIRVHQSSLLRSVRTVYNVFLMSRTPVNQGIAQGALNQMVGAVFSRMPLEEAHGEPTDTSTSAEPVTLQMLESRHSLDAGEKDEASLPIDAPDLLVKDAFLVLRALCKLTMKPLSSESERDMKSYSMRSKLLALRTVKGVLQQHMHVFTTGTVRFHSTTSGGESTFVQAVKQYLCLCISRNAVSSVLPVFEESCEIFWLVLSGMRNKMKKEIEVLMNEIYLPILEMRSSPVAQKLVLLHTLLRLCKDPQALVEVYLNYDCDRTALENLYERLMNVISRLTQMPGSEGAQVPDERKEAESVDVRLKRHSLECLCSVLRSLVEWMGRLIEEPVGSTDEGAAHVDDAASAAPASAASASASTSASASASASASTAAAPPGLDDDPGRFENAKQRKTVLLEAIRTFNFKPKRGIAQLIEHGFIRGGEPEAIARFLFYADGLSKRSIGEYLGEGDAHNIATMHAFVDLMQFDHMPLTTALRRFLQAFRLPGEAQKIDRFMLKFAERYTDGNQTAFANADTAYKLAYSVIMLNTDAHNPQVKHRMTLQDFLKNNAGLDDDRDLPEEYLTAIYDEIQKNEIKLYGEEAPTVPTSGGLAGVIATVGRDLQHEAYVLQTQGMANRTEVLFRTMLHAQQQAGVQRALAERYFSASHMEHVKPMFEVAWMSFLAGISAPLQNSNDADTIRMSLDGFKDAIKIVCFFGLELERNAFITTLAKFTFLNNFGEMKSKNVATIEALLDIAHTEGNFLQGSWREVLTCVSQLERFQLISGGVDERTLPDLGRRPVVVPSPGSSGATPASTMQASGVAATTIATSSSSSTSRGTSHMPHEDVIQAGASSEITVTADRVFSATPQLSGEAIVDFVQSLCDVSWEEIQSSGMSDNPRLFSLQKVVEISYYNMGRIRMEWSRLWAILGEHFYHVCCHPNPAVSAFGLDSLRQLASKFFEKEELLHFTFQKDFLKPFEYTMRRNADTGAKEMVLQCLDQMVQTRAERIRSGWTTILSVFGVAASATERIALFAFELVRRVQQQHMHAILVNGSFADLCVCLAQFGKVTNQRVSLPATELLKSIVPASMQAAHAADTPAKSLWLPMLFSLYDILMTGDDLEVRRVALDALFSILVEQGGTFSMTFWDQVCNDVLFPIFNVLRNRSDVTRFSTQEDMSVWLSTTMIQALRQLVALWTHFFHTLKPRLPGLLELLCACICQENDTLARIGTSCLQELIIHNMAQMDDTCWQQVVDAFLRLFRATTASQVFDPALSSPDDPLPAHERRHAFKQIIVKCVLQLLLIETSNELLQNTEVYEAVPVPQLLRLTAALEDSYRFSRRFNADRTLRTSLWKVGFMKQLPNLLKQESTSASTLVYVYLRMHNDHRASFAAHRAEVSERFLPLAEEIISVFLPLDNETQARNISAWTPVVAQVLLGLASMYEMDPHAHKAATPTFYLLVIELLDKISLAPALTGPLRRYLAAVGAAHGLIDKDVAAARARARDEARAEMLQAAPLGHTQVAADQSQADLRHMALSNPSVDAFASPTTSTS